MSDINHLVYEAINLWSGPSKLGQSKQPWTQFQHFNIHPSGINPHLNVRPVSTLFKQTQDNIAANTNKQPIQQRTARNVSNLPSTQQTRNIIPPSQRYANWKTSTPASIV